MGSHCCFGQHSGLLRAFNGGRADLRIDSTFKRAARELDKNIGVRGGVVVLGHPGDCDPHGSRSTLMGKNGREDFKIDPACNAAGVCDRNVGARRGVALGGDSDSLGCQCRFIGKNGSIDDNSGASGAFFPAVGQKCESKNLGKVRAGSSSEAKHGILGPACAAAGKNKMRNEFASSSGSEGYEAQNEKRFKVNLSVRTLAIAACFGGCGGLYKVLVSTLPPDFESRWRMLGDDEPQAETPADSGPKCPTVLFDRHGAVIATIAPMGCSYERDANIDRHGAYGKPMTVGPDDIPSWMWQAVVASEDRRFFKHQGVDPRGVSRAIVSLSASGGGSTITQQLVKNMFLSNERKWTRKLLEIILAFILEKRMSKWDILYLYLKKIYWGHGVYGIEGASALYFGKHPSLLSLGECAMLTGIIPAPELLSPYHEPSRGKKPQARALRRMVEAGFLDPSTATEAVGQPLSLAIGKTEGISGPWKAPYFVSEVLYELTQKYGWSVVAGAGLQVHTTLDLSMQTIAEQVVEAAGVEYDNERILLADKVMQTTQGRLEALKGERQELMTKVVEAVLRRAEGGGIAVSLPARKAAASVIRRLFAAEEYLQAAVVKFQAEIRTAEKSRMEAAMVAVDPMSGAVRVLVGGRDYYECNFNRGTQAFRSPGSTFKPVVYLAALAEGFKCDHPLMDEPFTIGGFTPENYDLKFRGQVTLEESLLYSLNVPTVKLCAEVGVDKVCDMGRALGIETFLPYELALALGGCEVTPMQLATVYATVAAGGVYHKPHLVTRVETCDGLVLEKHKVPQTLSDKQQATVVNESAVAELRRLLQAVVERGTGQAARLGRPCGGKTGTSNQHRDVWFAGFTPEISCTVWLGYDNNAPVGGLHPATGASHAAPVWKQFMQTVHEGVPVQQFHDVGSDRYGSRAPTQLERRSRRPPRVGLHKIRRHFRRKKETILWKQVWDWRRASISWEEQEKMAKWAGL